jgi:hypothetical protein
VRSLAVFRALPTAGAARGDALYDQYNRAVTVGSTRRTSRPALTPSTSRLLVTAALLGRKGAPRSLWARPCLRPAPTARHGQAAGLPGPSGGGCR